MVLVKLHSLVYIPCLFCIHLVCSPQIHSLISHFFHFHVLLFTSFSFYNFLFIVCYKSFSVWLLSLLTSHEKKRITLIFKSLYHYCHSHVSHFSPLNSFNFAHLFYLSHLALWSNFIPHFNRTLGMAVHAWPFFGLVVLNFVICM